MMRYADLRLCPSCRTALPANPQSCPSCHLPLRDPLTAELYQTFQHADVLLAQLRAKAAAEESTPSPAVSEGRVPSTARRLGLRTASVPVILLSLGALCLLVAAVTFLAVAWSWMGVGGRTGVLVTLTAAAAGAGVLLGRRGLRIAAESLTTVSLGLVALDVVGAITAGWLGDPDPAESTALVGAGVAALSCAMLVRSRLVVPQLGVVVGLVLAFVGVAVSTGHGRIVAFVAVLALATAASLGRLLGARTLRVTAALAAGTWWLWLLLAGLEDAFSDPSLTGLWTTPNALPLLGAAALLVGLAGLLHPSREAWAAASGAATIVTLLLAVPALDEGATAIGLALLSALVVWTAISAALSREVAYGPLALAAVPALAFTAAHLLDATVRVGSVGDPFTETAAVRLAALSPDTSPLLLVPLVAALLAAAWAATPLQRDRFVGVAMLVVAATATLALYSVPLAVVVGVLAVAALAVAWLGRPVLACLVIAVTIAAALPSAVLTLVACAAAVSVALLLLRSRATPSTMLGGLLLPAASAGVVWSGAEVAAITVDLRALPILVVLGLLAIAVPRVEVEASAAVTGLIAALAALDVAPDLPTALAIHLTVAGALVTLSSLVHRDRRVLAWPGGLLLAAATWVRLADLGVEAPEPYTLPSAVVLVIAALYRLRRTPGASTAVLLPGLTLATVPSLLWVLNDPVSPRAVVLGLVCLGLVLAGARLGWSAPLAVGGLVGGLLVLREVAPYASELPQWVLIGLAGTILTVVGVTWEHRIMELRRATAYLGRLR